MEHRVAGRGRTAPGTIPGRSPRAAAAGAAALLLALLLTLAVAAGCQRTDQPARVPAGAPAAGAPAADTAPAPIQEMDDYRLTETERGVRRWVLDSERMRRYAGQEDVELVDVHMDFFREGEHFSVLDADSGRVDPRTRAVHVWGHVDIRTDDGRRLETEDLHFDNSTGRITNEVFNRFTRGQDVVTGTGLDATPDLEYVEIKHEVEADVTDGAGAGGLLP